MKPVFQTRFGEIGNCFQAAVASLFEVSIDDVPDFCNEFKLDWFDQFISWLNGRGYSAVYSPAVEGTLGQRAFDGVLSLVHGMSPRGLSHTTIYLGDKLVHDPHPEGGKTEIHAVTIITPLNPTKLTLIERTEP